MKRFVGRLGLVLAVLAAAGTDLIFTPALRVPADVWGINSGLVPLDYADWGYLREGSGQRGRDALQGLARHGASDDIRITADYMLNDYTPPDRLCGDAPCAKPMPEPKFHPVATALEMVTDLRPGQVLPHEFVIDSANARRLHPCIHHSPDCVLRMQDFNGDGKDEVYIEFILHDGGGNAEDETRHLVIYCEDKGEWKFCNFLNFRNYDARNWPRRPFVVEATAMDDLVVNGTSFHFVREPHYQVIPWQEHPDYGVPEIKALGVIAGRIPVLLPKDGKMPTDLIADLRSGKVGLTPVAANPPLPMPYLNHGFYIEYTRMPSCRAATTCRAIIADLDHDGHDEVIVIDDPDPTDALRPLDATLLKSDGKAWRVTANIDLCKEIVSDIAKAKIEIAPAKQHAIRLGANLYPIEENPYCKSIGYIL